MRSTLLCSLMTLSLALISIPPGWADEKADLKAKIAKFNDITGKEALDGQFRALLKDKPGTKKLLQVAAELLKDKRESFNYNSAVLIGRTAEVLKNYELAAEFFGLCKELAEKLKSDIKIAEVYENFIDLQLSMKKYDEVIKTCREFLDIETDDDESAIAKLKPIVFTQMVEVMSRNKQVDEALKLLSGVLEKDASNWFFLRIKAIILRNGERYDEAADVFLDALEKVKKNKRLSEELRTRYAKDIRYQLSSVYVDLKQIDKSAEQLQILIKEDPENATYHNDLGFVWADHDMKLDEAEKLVRKAIELDRAKRKKNKDKDDQTAEDDKDNAAYLDSLGWVLFKQKKYKEAKKYLLEATADKDDEESQHVEILDHLADCHVALGETKEAIAIWERALKQENLSGRDELRKKKIEEKLMKMKK